MENWLPAVGFEEFYEVSDLGRVRSLRSGRIKYQSVASSWKTAQVHLNVNARQYTRYVAHLVLETFVGPRPEGRVCCHGSKGPTNNELDNLSWGTQSQNTLQDKLRDGTGSNKVTAAQVVEIRRRNAEGERQEDLAVEFGITQPAVSAICLRKTWKHLE